MAGTAALNRWSREQSRDSRAGNYPDRNTEYFLYQTLIGAWPIAAGAVDGVHGEGGARGQATDQLDATEQGVRGCAEEFIDSILGSEEFVAELEQICGAGDVCRGA